MFEICLGSKKTRSLDPVREWCRGGNNGGKR